jgi:hypothetical protein
MMPDNGLGKDEALIQAVRNGSLDASRLDDMATRIFGYVVSAGNGFSQVPVFWSWLAKVNDSPTPYH